MTVRKTFAAILVFSALSIAAVYGQDKNDALLANIQTQDDGMMNLKTLPDSLSLDSPSMEKRSPLLVRMVEWMHKYYNKPVDGKVLQNATGAVAKEFESFNGYEKAYAVMKVQSKRTGVIISEIYTLNDSRYESLVKDYNRQAKMDGTTQVKYEKNTMWACGGIRMELKEANLETLEKVMKAGILRTKISAFVKREIEAGRPLAWAKINGIGQGNKPKKGFYYGVQLCAITGVNADKNELEYIEFDSLNERKTMSYDAAATCTWAFYRILPK